MLEFRPFHLEKCIVTNNFDKKLTNVQKTLSLSKTIIETSNSNVLIVKELTNFANGSKSQEIVNLNLNDV